MFLCLGQQIQNLLLFIHFQIWYLKLLSTCFFFSIDKTCFAIQIKNPFLFLSKKKSLFIFVYLQLFISSLIILNVENRLNLLIIVIINMRVVKVLDPNYFQKFNQLLLRWFLTGPTTFLYPVMCVLLKLNSTLPTWQMVQSCIKWLVIFDICILV